MGVEADTGVWQVGENSLSRKWLLGRDWEASVGSLVWGGGNGEGKGGAIIRLPGWRWVAARRGGGGCGARTLFPAAPI